MPKVKHFFCADFYLYALPNRRADSGTFVKKSRATKYFAALYGYLHFASLCALAAAKTAALQHIGIEGIGEFPFLSGSLAGEADHPV